MKYSSSCPESKSVDVSLFTGYMKNFMPRNYEPVKIDF